MIIYNSFKIELINLYNNMYNLSKKVKQALFKCFKGCDNCINELDDRLGNCVPNDNKPEVKPDEIKIVKNTCKMKRCDNLVDERFIIPKLRKRSLPQLSNFPKRMRLDDTDSDWDFICPAVNENGKDNDKDNVKDNENDNGNVKDNENENGKDNDNENENENGKDNENENENGKDNGKENDNGNDKDGI